MTTDKDRIDFLESLLHVGEEIIISPNNGVEAFTAPAQWQKGATVREVLDTLMEYGIEEGED